MCNDLERLGHFDGIVPNLVCIPGLLKICTVEELQNPAKFMKTHKIPRNAIAIISNTCLYTIII